MKPDLNLTERQFQRKYERLKDAILEIQSELIVARPVYDILDDVNGIINRALAADALDETTQQRLPGMEEK